MRSRQLVHLVAFLLAIMVAHASAPGQTVATVAPPSWWVEAHEQSLMLLIEGTNLDGALVRVARGPIRVSSIEAGREGRIMGARDNMLMVGCQSRDRLQLW